MGANSNRGKTPSEPPKVRKHFVPDKPPECPLTPHASGKWMKKIKGKIHYFGNWGRIKNGKMERLPDDGIEEALEQYKKQKPALERGRTPEPEADDTLTVKQLLNLFLHDVEKRHKAGIKMSARMFAEYCSTAKWLADQVGKQTYVRSLRPGDFNDVTYALREKYQVARIGNEIQKIKTIFKWAIDNEHIKKLPSYGSIFKKPEKAEQREHRNAQSKKLFSAPEIRALLDAADVQLKAMILLGINCGFGNSDCALLPLSAVDLDKATIDFPRPKTKVERRCFLFKETVDALRAAIAARHKPKSADDAALVFITKYGHRWVRDRLNVKEPEKGSSAEREVRVVGTNAVGSQFGKLLKELHINGRKGLGFYSLRHTFRTVADATKDFVAARFIMGHADNSIDAVYRETIDDDRLRAVTEHVRAWLFADTVK